MPFSYTSDWSNNIYANYSYKGKNHEINTLVGQEGVQESFEGSSF